MRLSRAEFDAALADNRLRLALIGMSNIGKSVTARRLSAMFKTVEIDALIEAELGLTDMQALAEWMGFPWQDAYETRAAQYLAAEARLSLADYGPGNLVLDSTGSLIHIPANDKKTFRDRYLCVYLEASPHDEQRLADLYFDHPKPTIWGHAYQPLPEEDPQAALKRCYPDLLKTRTRLYEEMADVRLPAGDVYNRKHPEMILDLIRKAL